MKQLVIEANIKRVKENAVVLSGLTIILLLGGIIAAFYVDWGGPITWFFSGLLFGWMYLVLINMSLMLFKLSAFKGALITIGNEGLTDHFNKNRFLSWSEIRCIEWKQVRNKGVYVLMFRVVPKKPTLTYRLSKVFGWTQFQYLAQYLSVSRQDISKFIVKLAPDGILK